MNTEPCFTIKQSACVFILLNCSLCNLIITLSHIAILIIFYFEALMDNLFFAGRNVSLAYRAVSVLDHYLQLTWCWLWLEILSVCCLRLKQGIKPMKQWQSTNRCPAHSRAQILRLIIWTWLDYMAFPEHKFTWAITNQRGLIENSINAHTHIHIHSLSLCFSLRCGGAVAG